MQCSRNVAKSISQEGECDGDLGSTYLSFTCSPVAYIQSNNLTIPLKIVRRNTQETCSAVLNAVVPPHTARKLCVRACDKCMPAWLKGTRGLLIRREPLPREPFFLSVRHLICAPTSRCRRTRISPTFLHLASAPLFTTAVKSSLQRIVTEIDGGGGELKQPLSPSLFLNSGETILIVSADRTRRIQHLHRKTLIEKSVIKK